MEERYSRVEKDKNLYTNEVRSSKFLDILLHIFITLAVLITILCWQDVYAASDYHNVVTNAIYTGTTHCTTNQTGICTSDTSSTSYSRYTFGTTSYQNTLSMNFTLNTAIRANVHATIRLTGNYWANVSYTCQSSHFTNCRVVRANSTILNINFSNTTSSNVTYAEFFITANGSSLNTNSTFYVQKADLYETNITSSSSNDSTNQDVINNQNQNTEDIISNANQNTQDITNSINGAMKDIVSSASCPTGPLAIVGQEWALFEKQFLNDSGQLVNNNDYYVGPYLSIKPNTEYTIKLPGQYTNPSYCFYTGKQLTRLISCSKYNNRTSITFTTPSNATFMLVSYHFPAGVYITGPICNNWEKEAIDKSNNTQKETNDLIKDDSVDQSQANNFFSGFQDNDNGGISGLITKPLTIINNLLSNNSSCQNLTLPSFMGVDNAYLPSGCILWNNAPSTVITLWNTLVVGLGSYYILKKLFNDIQALKNPENDKVEVMDL